ncbi:MAG: hypothetical protein EON57_17785 [Alphaproteobacteria bacterium]|nr:MAG: hypothetical protein EON57_17785 [Alphaproteobacteria bacterium]
MVERIKDVIISTPSRRSAQIESWLLGHGFSTTHQTDSEDGAVRFYSVKELSADGRAQLQSLGATVVSEWKHGEVQSSTTG